MLGTITELEDGKMKLGTQMDPFPERRKKNGSEAEVNKPDDELVEPSEDESEDMEEGSEDDQEEEVASTKPANTEPEPDLNEPDDLATITANLKEKLGR